MNGHRLLFVIVLTTMQISFCLAGMLTAQKFPATANDLSFAARNENLTAGYEPYAGLSPYQMLQLQDLNEVLSQEVDQIEDENQNYCQGAGKNTPECRPVTTEDLNTALQGTESANAQSNPESVVVSPNVGEAPQAVTPQITIQNNGSGQSSGVSANGYCATRHPHIPKGQTLPVGVPISPSLPIYNLARQGSVCSSFGGYRGKKKNGQAHYHQGVDIGCSMGGQPAKSYFGTPVFASARGVVRSVQPASACKASGNMIRIEHADGFVSYYMHLDKMFVKVGDVVEAGCQIATMGHSGGSLVTKCPSMGIDMTHLHYELRHPRKPSSVKFGDKKISLKYKGGTSFDPVPLMKI